MDIKLHYIYHSGFAIETEQIIIIIDYYKDSSKAKGIVYNKLLKSKKKLYVLSTHIHYDHFNPEIFNWKEINPNIIYVLSTDIMESKDCCKKDDAIFLAKGESWSSNDCTIEAFGSTDAGISFAITIDSKKIFHAGDLNNWHWKDESSDAYIKEAEQFYLSELEFLKEKYKAFDLVMFPVDQRMQTDYDLGAKQFVENIKVHYFAPMHFDEHYNEANAFDLVAQKNNANFIKITQPGEEFKLKL